MRYDKYGLYRDYDDTIWRREPGYQAYGVSDICVGSEIMHGDRYHRVIGIQEVLTHGDIDGGLTFMVQLDDGTVLILKHYGTPRHSGRYPWGSGDNPYQRNADFLGRVAKMRKEVGPDGKPLFTEKQIAESMGMKTTELRKRISVANSENWAYRHAEYKRLKAKGMSRSAIARRMGEPESTLRNWDNERVKENMTKNSKNAKILEDRVKEVGFVQVGSGNELFLNNTSKTSLDNTLKALEKKGYTIHNLQVEQLGTGKMTTVKVLANPGVELKDVYKNMDKIRLPVDIQETDGEWKVAEPPVSVDKKRVQICYNEEGGLAKDGLIEVRRGVKDLDLGRNHYVQGRILVDNDHFLKGMITYADDLPEGIDIRFNTNKHVGTPMINREDKDNSVLKPIKTDSDNIFGANIKSDKELIRVNRTYIDDDGKEKQSAINIVKEEGDVDAWAKNLASQFLSKQPSELAKRQLKTLRDISKSEMDEIASYNNPLVRAKMLEDFAGRCDRSAVHLEAAALPRQKTKFILPLTNLRENECYLPGYKDGEQVALVRYPHGSISEIPIVTVNNNNRKAKATIGDAIDAIGINQTTAERLSGADFDGDTVLVLPMSSARIKNKPRFKELENFDHLDLYKGYEGMKRMTKHQKAVEMGVVSNLLTDMTIQGASDDEIARALRHSMVVIDAEKHGLDWKRSEIENNIPALKKKYQPNGGASTLLSRSTADDREVPERVLKTVGRMTPDELKRWKEGEEIWRNTGRTRRDAKKLYPRSLMTKEEKEDIDSGDAERIKKVHQKFWEDGRVNVTYKEVMEKPIKKGYLYDPEELTSTGNLATAQPIERVYAEHAREMKNIAKQARKLAREDDNFEVDKEAKIKYAPQVESLNAKLSIARRNAPLEKQAQIIANLEYNKWKWEHADEDNDHKKREKGRILDRARQKVGAKKLVIGSDENPLTPKEWEAIQAHAVSKTTLRSILNNADMNVVRKYAMPKEKAGMPAAKVSRAKMLLNKGYSRMEVCDMLDISEHTLIDAIGLANI
ncbi:helix-turn-helix domain-containing protein [Pseudobutyrivibrio sp.]